MGRFGGGERGGDWKEAVAWLFISPRISKTNIPQKNPCSFEQKLNLGSQWVQHTSPNI